MHRNQELSHLLFFAGFPGWKKEILMKTVIVYEGGTRNGERREQHPDSPVPSNELSLDTLENYVNDGLISHDENEMVVRMKVQQ